MLRLRYNLLCKCLAVSGSYQFFIKSVSYFCYFVLYIRSFLFVNLRLSASRLSLRGSDRSSSGHTVSTTHLRGEGFKHFFVIHLLLIDAQPREQAWRQDKLDDKSPDEREGANNKTDSLLSVGEVCGLESTTTELDKDQLDNDDQKQDDNESWVVAESREHVVFIV